MPIYEFRCKKGHNFEVMQRMSDDPVTECTVCGASVERVFHPIAVHFKGSGFYNTDYGTKKRSREQKEHADGKKAKESSKSDSKDSNGSKPDSGAKPKTESAPAASASASKSTSSSKSD